jgi:hypothetical protein
MSNTSVAKFEYATSSVVRARALLSDPDRWLWDGYLAAANVTLLVGQWKGGKTTLLSVLLARLGAGGVLAGLRVRPGRAVVISEEAEDLWAERIERLALGDQLTLLSRPFRGRPTPDAWQQLVDSLVARHQDQPFDLVVIDPLAAFLPGRTENDAGGMLDTLLPLQALTLLGVSVLVLHHPRKDEKVPGRLARGSGALSGSVDILIELELIGSAADDDRRRKLSAFSRHRSTARRMVIELTEDGTDYVSLGDYVGNDFEDNWPILAGVLEDADHKLTRKQIRDYWPEDFVRPSAMMLWRWLDRAVKEKRVLSEGTGRRGHPFVYWLDGMEEVWKSVPGYLPPLEWPFKRITLVEALAERARKAEQKERREERRAMRLAQKRAAGSATGEQPMEASPVVNDGPTPLAREAP